MKKIKQKVLGFDIESLIVEAVQSLFEDDQNSSDMKEKLKQNQAADDAKDRKSSQKNARKAAKEGMDEDDEAEIAPKEKKAVTVSSDKLPDITVDAVIEKLNGIRSGVSLKEKEAKNSLSQYFEKLNGPERVALFAFLSGLDKVLGGDTSGAEVKTPHSEPYNVDMDQDTKKKVKKTKGTKSTGAEETPIVVGESSNKSFIKKILASHSIR